MITLTNTFVDDLLELEQSEVKRVLAALSKLQGDPRHPGLQTKKMEGSDFYEIRASQDLRIIADLFSGDPVCCIADHHDAALRRALLIGKPTPSARVRDSRYYESGGTTYSSILAHLTDEQLTSAYGVPDEWLATIRSLSSGDAISNSGIDEVIGVEATLRLAAESRVSADEDRGVHIVRGDLILHSINDFVAADVVDQVILISPFFSDLARSREFVAFADFLRERKTRTLVITRESDASDHVHAIDLLSRISTAEVLLNDGIGLQIAACLAPTPWGFGALGSGGTVIDSAASIGIFVPSRVGEDRAIRQLASIAMEIRTALDTQRYVAAK